MADRVAIIGGSTVGRDHFPFPVVDGTGIDNVYPFPAVLESVLKWFYLVKRWKIEVAITVAVPDPDPDIVLNATYYADAGAVIHNGATDTDGYIRESDLVVPRVTFSSDNSVTSNFALFFDESDPDFPSGQRMSFDGTLFYPAFYIDADEAVSSADDAFGATLSGTTVNFMGEAGWTLFGDPDHVGTIVVSAEEYWPYATKAGLPVYDTSTGAQINDPFS